jgi:(p)ppGpp synthase/HD superfamily hydrolase
MLELKAQEFATKAHADNITPYINHPAGVVRLLRDINVNEEDILCAAWLHDTIEDCDVTEAQLKTEFNLNIARIVQALTRDVDRDIYKERIKKSDYAVQIVKLADTVHNCSRLHNGLKPSTIKNKVDDYPFYLALAERIAPQFAEKLKADMAPWIGA